MKLLLDTHAFLWYYMGSPELSNYARTCIDDPNNDFWVSVASVWEISIKYSLGKLVLDKDFDEFCQDIVSKGFQLLPLDLAHIITQTNLPFHSRDPFDRILVAQAITENLHFVTKDNLLDLYFQNEMVKRVW